MDEGVDVQLLQVAAGFPGAAAGVGPYAPGVVGAADVGGQIAAAVRRDQFQVRMAVQDAGEDQVGERDGVLGGLADRVGQVPLVQALVERAAEGVQEDQRAALLGPRPQGFVGGVGEFAARRVRGDLHALQPLFQCVIEQLHGEVGVLEGDQSEAEQPVGGLRAVRRGALVGRPADPAREFGPGPVVVVRRGRADQLDVHTLCVHGRQPHGDVRQSRHARAHHGPAHGQGRRAVAAGVQGPGLGQARLAGHGLLDLRQQEMGVDVDRRGRLGLGHGLTFSAFRVRRVRPGTSASRTPSSVHRPSCTEASTTMRTRGSRRAW
ncbi:hypothetical protein RKD19_005827 [Streptomyces canus]